MRVSIDFAVQHCEVHRKGLSQSSLSARRYNAATWTLWGKCGGGEMLNLEIATCPHREPQLESLLLPPSRFTLNSPVAWGSRWHMEISLDWTAVQPLPKLSQCSNNSVAHQGIASNGHSAWCSLGIWNPHLLKRGGNTSRASFIYKQYVSKSEMK